MMSRLSVTYFIHGNWRKDPAGTSTFVQLVEAEWRGRGIQFIELPFDPGSNTGGVVPEAVRPGNTSWLTRHSAMRSMLLLLGYGTRFREDVRFLRRIRSSVTGAVLLTNQFGCETLPLALRWVFPRRKILAIAHTHPGQDMAARHVVRSLIERLCYHCVSGVIYNSSAVRALWACKLGRATVKGGVIHHGLPDSEMPLQSDYPARKTGFVDFVYVARFYSWKGQEGFLNAWKMAVDAGMRNARAVLVGDGERLDAARELARTLGISESVLFLGNRPDGAACLAAGDVAVLLSAEPEAFGFVLLEAMRAGRPVLASRLGGIPEIVEDGHTGVLVDPGDCAAVARALCSLASDHVARARMGMEGRRRWAEAFSLDRMLKEYDAVFAQSKATLEGGHAVTA